MKTIIKSLLCAGVACVSLLAQAGEWQLEKDDAKTGIKVYTRVVEGSPLKEFKGVAKVDSSLMGIVALIDDRQVGPEWIQDNKLLETVEKPSATEVVSYMVTAAPWPVKDRDATVYSKMTQDLESKEIHIALQAVTDKRPEVKGRVRITELKGFWHLKPIDANSTVVTYQVHANPAGSLPEWLINSLVVNMPYHTLKNMQTKVQEEKYQKTQLDTVRNF